MELEDRVQALEEEIQILKSQIQNTLLDIQEQLLTNAHPSLRSETRGENRSENETTAPRPTAAPPLRSVSLNGDQADCMQVADDEGDTLRLAPQSYPQPQPEPTPAPPRKKRTPMRPEDLEAWVYRKLAQVGPQQTKRLIRRQAENGQISGATANHLLQLVKAQAAPPSPKVPEPRRTAATRPPQRPPHPPTPSASPAPRPSPSPSRPAVAAADDEDELPDESHHNTILRLIAGVANAGAGMKWSRNDG